MENSDQKFKRSDKKKKKDTELKNFYRFQVREEKMKQLDQLRKKFEEDKKKVERMKATRKFNPF
jgi:ribosomal RNA-processing protein 7